MNGWTNRATWLVNLWYNPETKSDIAFLEETLEEDFNEMMEVGKYAITLESTSGQRLGRWFSKKIGALI